MRNIWVIFIDFNIWFFIGDEFSIGEEDLSYIEYGIVVLFIVLVNGIVVY